MILRVAIVLGLLVARGSVQAGDGTFVIIQPGYPGSTAEAEVFVSDLAQAIAKAGGPKGLQGLYHNAAVEGLAALREKKPVFAIVSTGFFLAHREALRLAPLLETAPASRFYLAAKKGQSVQPQDLAGKAVLGTPFHEKEFVERILFGAGALGGAVTSEADETKADPPPAAGGAAKAAVEVSRWKAEATQGFSKGVRDVARDKAAAVLLTERERKAMKEITAGKELDVTWRSEALPTALMVALGDPTPETQEAAKALQALKGSDAGKEILATMGMDGFTKPDLKRLGALEARYGLAKQDGAKAAAK